MLCVSKCYTVCLCENVEAGYAAGARGKVRGPPKSGMSSTNFMAIYPVGWTEVLDQPFLEPRQ